MTSRKGSHPFISSALNLASKGKAVSDEVGAHDDQLTHGMGQISLDSSQDGQWEVYSKKSKNRAANSAAKPWGTQSTNSKAWQQPAVPQKLGAWGSNVSGKAPSNSFPSLPNDPKTPAGRGNARSNLAPSAAVPPPLQPAWNRPPIASSTHSRAVDDVSGYNGVFQESLDEDDKDDDIDDDDESMDDSDDDFLSDGFDSDASQKSHDTRKKGRWFKTFFDILDSLTIEEINEPTRQWHCPACHGGPGAIDWYKGLQPLMTHAKTKGAKRVKLHRELAELLDEELRRRGTSAIPAGEAFGKWKGLNEKAKDHEIVWPPMVAIMNTQLEQGDDDRWTGMGNQELLDYFQQYAAVKARHAYGPKGHRGMSLLIFESSAVGYMEAERLHKHFQQEGTDRNAWERPHKVLFYPGGQRQLYGYLARKEDLDSFNKHSHGKMKLKFELRSYQEMVVSHMKQMSEENQQLTWFKNKVAKEQRHSKALEESFGIVTEKLRSTMEASRVVQQRTKKQHAEYKEEMAQQELFYQEQMKVISEARDKKEDEFERGQQKKREKVKQLTAHPATAEDRREREKELQEFIKLQDHKMEEFDSEKEKLTKAFEERKMEMKKRHWEEELQLEKEYNAEYTHLMDRYCST